MNGPQSFGGIEGTTTFFGNIGIPLAGFFAVVVALVEFFGGIALLLGLGTRTVSGLLAITMLVALIAAHIPQGYDAAFERALLALGAAIALMFTGSGSLSLDRVFCKEEKGVKVKNTPKAPKKSSRAKSSKRTTKKKSSKKKSKK